MARRVKQADGTYCYTDNGRIHDRSMYDSSGLQAVLGDAKEARQEKFTNDAADAISSALGVDSDTAKKLAAKITHESFNSNEPITAYSISKELEKAAGEDGIDISKWSSGDFIDTSYSIHNGLVMDSIVRRGDEVVINETGERGTICEGDSMFGGAIRLNPEDPRSRNSFAWLQPEDVTKVVAGDKSLARQRIIATPKDHLIPAATVKQLMEEETSSRTRNAQASREFGKHGKVAKAALRKFGDDFAARYEGKGVTRSMVLNALNKEYFREPDEGMTPEEVRATKSGYRNLITYLEGTK